MSTVSTDAGDSPGRFEFVQRAIDGDRIALAALLAESRAQLLTRVQRRVPATLRSLLDPDDVVQDAHVEVFRRIGVFKPQTDESFDRWVTTITMRQLQSLIRWHRASKRGGNMIRVQVDQRIEDSTVMLFDQLLGPGKTPSQSAARREVVTVVHEAINSLAEDHRRAVWAVHIEGKHVAAVAVELNCSERAVHGLCRRGLARLRRRLTVSSQYLSSAS